MGQILAQRGRQALITHDKKKNSQKERTTGATTYITALIPKYTGKSPE